MPHTTGTCFGVGIGPGDPDLITLKGVAILQSADLIAWPAPDEGPSLARAIAAPHIPAATPEYPIIVPMRPDPAMAEAVFKRAASDLAGHLRQGKNVAVLCEGDPFFYGSFISIYTHLAPNFSCQIIPGISSLHCASALLKQPLGQRNDRVSVIPAGLDNSQLAHMFQQAECCAIIKLGRHWPRVRDLLREQKLDPYVQIICHASHDRERILDFKTAAMMELPYFSILLLVRPDSKSVPIES